MLIKLEYYILSQINCTGLMFILAAVDVYRVLYVSLHAFGLQVLNFGCYEMGFKKQNSRKNAIMAI